MIPSLAIAAVLIAAWRREWIGTALLALAAGLYAVRVLPQHVDWALTISGPLLVIAGLFLMSWIVRSKLRAALLSPAQRSGLRRAPELRLVPLR